MITRAFGPTRGAGTRIEEQEGEKTITPGALGFVGYAGIMEKGPVGELILISGGKTELLKVTGGIIPDSLLPDAAQDYFSLGSVPVGWRRTGRERRPPRGRGRGRLSHHDRRGAVARGRGGG